MPENIVWQLRQERKWSQAFLADKVGEVTRQTIAAIENNHWCPSLDLARRIAVVFDLPIETIFYPEQAASDQPQHAGGNHVRSDRREH